MHYRIFTSDFSTFMEVEQVLFGAPSVASFGKCRYLHHLGNQSQLL